MVTKKKKVNSFGSEVYGWTEDFVTELTKFKPTIKLHIHEQSSDYKHVLACLSITYKRRKDKIGFIKETCELLQGNSREVVLLKLTRIQGLAAVTRRLPHSLQDERFYRKLFTAIKNVQSKNLLSTAAVIEDFHLRALEELPRALLTKKIFAKLFEESHIESAKEAFHLTERLQPTWTTKKLVHLLSEVEDFDQLFDWVKRVSLKTALPPSPIKSVPLLEPINSLKMMRKAGRDFRNCLKDDDKILEVISGQTYYYKWLGDKKVIISLRKLDYGDIWTLEELLGPRNRSVSNETVRRVIKLMSPLGIITSNYSSEFDELPAFLRRRG